MGVVLLSPGYRCVALAKYPDFEGWQFPSQPTRPGVPPEHLAVELAAEQLGLEVQDTLCRDPVLHVSLRVGRRTARALCVPPPPLARASPHTTPIRPPLRRASHRTSASLSKLHPPSCPLAQALGPLPGQSTKFLLAFEVPEGDLVHRASPAVATEVAWQPLGTLLEESEGHAVHGNQLVAVLRQLQQLFKRCGGAGQSSKRERKGAAQASAVRSGWWGRGQGSPCKRACDLHPAASPAFLHTKSFCGCALSSAALLCMAISAP